MSMDLRSALDTSAATTILFALTHRRGSQVVRSRSAKPLFAGSIPAPACLIASAHLPERQERQAEFLSKEKSVTRLLTRSGNALHWLYRSNETREQSEKAPVTQAKPPASRG